MTPMPTHGMSNPTPNSAPSFQEKQATDWLLTDAFYNGRLSVREYNTRLRALWQVE